jgi:hypothetical protein
VARQAASYEPAIALQRFVLKNKARILNVVGTRPSKEPDVWRFAFETIEAAFFWSQSNPEFCVELELARAEKINFPTRE